MHFAQLFDESKKSIATFSKPKGATTPTLEVDSTVVASEQFLDLVIMSLVVMLHDKEMRPVGDTGSLLTGFMMLASGGMFASR